MPSFYPQFPELTEMGMVCGLTKTTLDVAERSIETPFAFATLPINGGYLSAGKALEACGWANLGNRYNALHGPNYISLWWKQFQHKPLAGAKNTDSPYDYYNHRKNVPPKSRYANACCGLLLNNYDQFDEFKSAGAKTDYLMVVRLPEDSLPKRLPAGWHPVASAGGYTYLVNTQSGNFKKDGEPSLLVNPTDLSPIKSPSKEKSPEAPKPAPARRRKVALARLK